MINNNKSRIWRRRLQNSGRHCNVATTTGFASRWTTHCRNACIQVNIKRMRSSIEIWLKLCSTFALVLVGPRDRRWPITWQTGLGVMPTAFEMEINHVNRPYLICSGAWLSLSTLPARAHTSRRSETIGKAVSTAEWMHCSARARRLASPVDYIAMETRRKLFRWPATLNMLWLSTLMKIDFFWVIAYWVSTKGLTTEMERFWVIAKTVTVADCH